MHQKSQAKNLTSFQTTVERGNIFFLTNYMLMVFSNITFVLQSWCRKGSVRDACSRRQVSFLYFSECAVFFLHFQMSFFGLSEDEFVHTIQPIHCLIHPSDQFNSSQISPFSSISLRLVIHDWERPYYKEGAKSLGYILEKEVQSLKIALTWFRKG